MDILSKLSLIIVDNMDVSIFLNKVLVVFAFFVTFQANKWNDLIPLVSTRVDVEKILGPPISSSKVIYAAEYKTEDAKISIGYSTGCSRKPNDGWDVPPGRIINITVYPNVRQKFSSNKLNLTKYTKITDRELERFTYYTSEEDGISITVNTDDDEITSVSYFPMAKDNKLLCRTSLPKKKKTKSR